jgi:fumarate reductase subunit D
MGYSDTYTWIYSAANIILSFFAQFRFASCFFFFFLAALICFILCLHGDTVSTFYTCLYELLIDIIVIVNVIVLSIFHSLHSLLPIYCLFFLRIHAPLLSLPFSGLYRVIKQLNECMTNNLRKPGLHLFFQLAWHLFPFLIYHGHLRTLLPLSKHTNVSSLVGGPAAHM